MADHPLPASASQQQQEGSSTSRNHQDHTAAQAGEHPTDEHAVTTAALAAQQRRGRDGNDMSGPSSASGSTASSVTARGGAPTPTAMTTASATRHNASLAPLSLSTSDKKKLARAEAATAAAIGGSLDSPSLSASSPSTPSGPSTASGNGSGNADPNAAGRGSAFLNSRSGGADKGEGTITNTSATGPPTPSATRLPFLPSALKKHSAFSSSSNRNDVADRNTSRTTGGPVTSHSSSSTSTANMTSHLNNQKDVDGNQLSSSSSKQKKDKKLKDTKEWMNSTSSRESCSSAPCTAGETSIDHDNPNTGIISTNAYEKSYNATAAKTHSKREREEAREERVTERLYGSNMGSNSATHLPIPVGSSNTTNPAATVGELDYATRGQPSSKKTPGAGQSTTTTTTTLPPTSYGFASPHMSPALLEAGQGRYSRENSYLNSSASASNYPSNLNNNVDAQGKAAEGGRLKSAREIQEEEENKLAAKLGGGIGPTTSRIKKSTKKAPSSPNNVQGEKIAAEFEKEQRDYLAKNGHGKKTSFSRGVIGPSNKLPAEVGNENDNNDDGGVKRKDIQLQFSPKVRKPLNISWRAIKRKFLLASTGTPSSGEGSRRSETSETSGGSRRRMYNSAAGSSSNPGSGGHHPHGEKSVHIQGIDDGLGQEDWEVNQVVVDNDWFDDEGNPILWGGSTPSGSAHNGTGNAPHGHTDKHGHSSNSGAHGHHGERVSNSGKDTATNHSETAGSLIINPTIKAIDGVVTFFKGYLIPKCAYFFEPRFGDAEKELNFRKERWYNTKRNAAFGCFFLILNWILLVALIKMQGLYQQLLYYGLLTLFVWPMPVFVAFDLPRTWPMFYSFWAMTAAMLPGFFGIISMYVCRFLIDGSGACNGQTFLTIHYYATAFAVVALFALHVNRLAAVISQVIYWIMTCVMLLPEAGSYARTAINFLVFSAFIIYLHFQQEKIDRRMFTLRTQLKISYRALQKSQIAEKKAANSKKRFISYIFHEVRVPLNTAYLAFQNLQQSNGFNRQDEDQMVEVYALESSLQQVQQVLNDVLDLQRMDAGKFESSSQPFNFHRAINALVASLKVATTAKRLDLDVQLDEAIDSLPQSIDINGQRASYVIGDEIRLRQVLTNIASNAVKFSREGRGGIRVRTKLIWPHQDVGEHGLLDDHGDDEEKGEQRRISDGTNVGPSDATAAGSEWKDSDITPTYGNPSNDTPFTDSELTFDGAAGAGRRSSRERDIEKEAGLDSGLVGVSNDGKEQEIVQSASYPPSPSRSRNLLPRHDSDDTDASSAYGKKRRKDFVIVRIEIEDNGPGIRPSDMVDQRLFSAYVQTEIGRVQGGKGSGLGLAIVRAIVQMTRGRLGVQSSKNGTTFWIEQRYHFATRQEVEELQALQDLPTPYSFNAEPLPKPVRPPVKPYKLGESSYSQYSASRLEAAMQQVDPLQSTPTSEMDRPVLPGSLGGLPLPTQPSRDSANMSAESLRAGSASVSSMPSVTSAGNTSAVGTTSAINAMDVHSPLTSEQWGQNSVERSVMPTMSLTAPTPPSQTPAVAPIPSSTRSSGLAGATAPFSSPANSITTTNRNSSSKSPVPSVVNRTFSDDAKSAISAAGSSKSAISSGAVPAESPAGEDAFTPMTRHIVTTATPEGEVPPVTKDGRISPLPLPRPTSQSSVPSVAASHSSASGAGSANNGERLNALVVDDDPLTRKLMSRMMTRLGCQVEDAENGQMFLDVALGNKEQGREPKIFDIVTLDNAMPVMTGEQAIKIFRKAGRTDLVVGATGNALKGDQTSYLRAGVDTVLTKPISARDLTAQLNLARKRRQQQAEEMAAELSRSTAGPVEGTISPKEFV